MNPTNFGDALMREAIQLSNEHMLRGEGGPFGAVIVHDGEIVARGWNRVLVNCDPTAHAEVVAIRAACQQLKTFRLTGCEIYSSCEPCPLCLAAIYWARLDRIWFAASCDDAARAGFDDCNFYEELARPQNQRTIPMQQLLRSEATPVLEAWARNPDRTAY